MAAIKRACALVFVLVAVGCGGDTTGEAPVDAGVDVATAPVVATGMCHFDGVSACTGDPNCCKPFQGAHVDFVRNCVEAVPVPIGCDPPGPDQSGLHCGIFVTGDFSCFSHHAADGGADEVVVSEGPITGVDGFTNCDDATKAALAKFFAVGSYDGAMCPK